MTKSMSQRVIGFALALCFTSAAALLVLPVSASAETCPNEAFRTGPSANLPDCRAYELVTPPFKEASLPELRGTAFGIRGLTGVSLDGSRVDVTSTGNFGDANNNLAGASYELTRTESGWGEANVDLPGSRFPADSPLEATPDLRETLWEGRATSQPLDAKDLFIRAADGSLRDLGPVSPPSSTTEPPGLGFGRVGLRGGGEEYRGASEDLSHVLFTLGVNGYEPNRLWPGDTTVGLSEERSSLYEYTGGPPALVGVESGGHQIGQCGDEFGGISGDGSRVFFTVNPGGCETGASGPPIQEVFARIDESQTVAISEPSPADCSTCDTSPGVLAGASFNAVSADGSKVFFTTTQRLLGADTSANIYEYDFENPAGQRIIQVSGGVWGAGGAQVHHVFKVSRDGSHVYFVAQGALSGAANSQGQHPAAGGENLYVFERDAQLPSGRLSFIATLSSSDSDECDSHSCHGATVTPDGRFLALTSSADLTPGDTSGAQQVFRYDAQTGELVRVSIGQNGFNDNGNTNTFDASIPPQYPDSNGNHPLAISNDGAYVVFQSADGLTPLALNGKQEEFETELGGEKRRETYYANNVYEYRDGNVYLISDGQDATQVGGHSSVQLDGISASGNDIFFETADRLVAQDVDTQVDVYDARIGGGFPAPVSLLPACSGDACQGQLSPSPVLLSPGSEFQAGGNPPLAGSASATKPKSKPKVKTCTKGHVRKHGRCVKHRARRVRASTKGRK
jgi:hypothetical protein